MNSGKIGKFIAEIRKEKNMKQQDSLDFVENLGYFIEIEVYNKNLPIKESNKLLLDFIKEMKFQKAKTY